MKKFHLSWVAAAAVALLVGCSGGGAGDQSPRVEYGKLVVFGDSLSDVGSYNVGLVAALGGGKYTINGSHLSLNWTELLATTMGVDAPCAAQTGLNTNEAILGFPPVPEVNHAECFNYAQGGSRVTNPIGVANAALLALGDPSGALGQLTKPVVEQIGRHLTNAGGSFAADDLVTVMAGGNDLFLQLATFEALVGGGMPVAAATELVVGAMTKAGTELAGYVKGQIVAKGAARVVVINVPAAQKAPAFIGTDAAALAEGMILAFNGALAAGLAGDDAHILQVDAYSVSLDQAEHPAQYGLTNVTTPACDIGPGGVLENLPTSLVCTVDTLAVPDPSTYEYADTVHPTPYGYKLLAQLVTQELAKKRWL